MASFRKTFDGKLSFEEIVAQIEQHPSVNSDTHFYDASSKRETTTGDNIFNLITRKFGEAENEVVCINWGGSWYCMGVNLRYPS